MHSIPGFHDQELVDFKEMETILDQKTSKDTLQCEIELANKYGIELEKTEHGFEKQTCFLSDHYSE